VGQDVPLVEVTLAGDLADVKVSASGSVG